MAEGVEYTLDSKMLQLEESPAAGAVTAPATPTIAPIAAPESASTGTPHAMRVPARRANMMVDGRIGQCILRVRGGSCGLGVG